MTHLINVICSSRNEKKETLQRFHIMSNHTIVRKKSDEIMKAEFFILFVSRKHPINFSSGMKFRIELNTFIPVFFSGKNKTSESEIPHTQK